jgi:hypothetical protein
MKRSFMLVFLLGVGSIPLSFAADDKPNPKQQQPARAPAFLKDTPEQFPSKNHPV